MAIFQIQGKDAVIKFGPYTVVNAVQSFDWDPSFNEEYFEELGNPLYAAQAITPEVSGSFEITATGGTVYLLKRMIYTLDTATGEFEGYKAGLPGSSTLGNDGTIREVDLELAVFDLIEAKKANEAFTRSVVLPRAHLASIAWSASADGTATQTVNFEGDLAEVYRGTKRDILTLPAERLDATTIELADEWGVNPTPTTGTHVIEYLMIDEVKVPGTGLTITGAGPYEIELPAGVTVEVGQRLSLLAYAKTPGAFPGITYATDARFMRGSNINIWLVKKSTKDISTIAEGSLNAYNFADADLLLRVQSADISVDMRREPLRQIKKNKNNSTIYYRAATFPLQVTSNLSSFETDLADWAKMQGVTDPNEMLDLGKFENKDWQIVMRFYHGEDVLETIVFGDARVSGRGSRISVGGRAEASWSFTGSQLRIEGSEI